MTRSPMGAAVSPHLRRTRTIMRLSQTITMSTTATNTACYHYTWYNGSHYHACNWYVIATDVERTVHTQACFMCVCVCVLVSCVCNTIDAYVCLNSTVSSMDSVSSNYVVTLTEWRRHQSRSVQLKP